MISNGHFFKNPWIFQQTSALVDTATHPPAFPLMLALWQVLGIGTIIAQLLMLGVIGAVTVAAIAVLARRLAGDWAGLIAALLATVHPLLWINDVTLMSESLYQLVIVFLMIASYRYIDVPGSGRIAAVGALIGVAALVRGEALLFGPLLLMPLVCLTPKNRTQTIHTPTTHTREDKLPRQWIRHLAFAGTAAVAIITPWVVYTNIVYDKPVLITSATGKLLLYSSCDSTWYTGDLGGFTDCFLELDLWEQFKAAFPDAEIHEIYDRTLYDASQVDRFYRSHALEYIGDNLSRYPIVMLARTGTLFGIYNPDHPEVVACCGRWSGAGKTGQIIYYALILPAMFGIQALRRNGKRMTPLLVMWPAVAITTALTLIQLRFRVPVDVAMIVLGSIGFEDWRQRCKHWWNCKRQHTDNTITG